MLALLFSLAMATDLTTKDLKIPTTPAPRFVVVDFWASWCEPCTAAAPFYEKQFQKWKDKNVYFVGANQDDDEKAQKEWLGKHDVSFPQIYDKDHALANKLGIDTLPRLLVFDSKMKLLKTIRGFPEDDDGQFKAQLEKDFAEIFATSDTKGDQKKGKTK